MCFKIFINTCVVLIQHICLLCFAFANFLYLQINKSIITASKPVCKGRTVYITLCNFMYVIICLMNHVSLVTK